jgi:hypothetical protein
MIAKGSVVARGALNFANPVCVTTFSQTNKNETGLPIR